MQSPNEDQPDPAGEDRVVDLEELFSWEEFEAWEQAPLESDAPAWMFDD